MNIHLKNEAEMKKKRMDSAERRDLILKAAKHVFSQFGYEGARTRQIAQEAQVSEALIYRHFPSKMALYEAVMEQIYRQQDSYFDLFRMEEANAAGLVRAVKSYFNLIASDSENSRKQDARMLLASLIGDGNLAGQIYQRAQKINAELSRGAHENARKTGEMTGKPLDTANTTMFIEHVGTMIGAITMLPAEIQPYSCSNQQLATEAVWFCCRGMGLPDEVIARHVDN